MTAGFEQIIFLNAFLVSMWVSDGCLGVMSCGEGELIYEAFPAKSELLELKPPNSPKAFSSNVSIMHLKV